MLKNSGLERLESHWAVSAIPEIIRTRCFEEIKQRQVYAFYHNAMEFPDFTSEDFEENLQKLALAYEIPAIENMRGQTNYVDENCDRELFTAAAFRCYDIHTMLPLSQQWNQKIYQVLHICAMAYCGERWNDLKKWYLEKKEEILSGTEWQEEPSWESQVLKSLYRCWLKLYIKKDWQDMETVAEEIARLRTCQQLYEEQYLNETVDAEYRALVLVSLYHLAKATEILAVYMMQGEENAIHTQLDKHFESAIESAEAARDAELDTLLRWMHCASNQMVDNSIWWVARAINSRTTDFVRHVTKDRGLFEMLPPQKAAIREQGLLDQATTAIAVEMPTSGGKTLLAEFKILQALNQFDQEQGWVAYVAPTRALVSQITRRLKRDFVPEIKVEQLSAAVEIDSYEEQMLESQEKAFDVLVATPEKMSLVIKNRKIGRPLALVVMDEAHNIEDENRGLRIELFLAVVKTDCPRSNFLLLMPYVANADQLSRWLASDAMSGRSISIGTTPWKPSERIVGIYEKQEKETKGDWNLSFETLLTMSDTVGFEGKFEFDGNRYFGLSRSQATLTDMTAAMALKLSGNGTCLAIGSKKDTSWKMAEMIAGQLDVFEEQDWRLEHIRLVQRYLVDEMGEHFKLIHLLDKGVGVHNAGLPDEMKELIEWLAEEGCLKVLCATTTIAQGINFPVNSVCLQTINMSKGGYSGQMSPREFWNLAGRAGRIGQNGVGLVGLACKDETERQKLCQFVSRSTGNLVSRLVVMLDELEEQGELFRLKKLIYREEWTDFRCYIAHLCNETEKLDDVLYDMEQSLRNTFGYQAVRAGKNGETKTRQLLGAARDYAIECKNAPFITQLADRTGFSPEGVKKAYAGVRNLDQALSADRLKPDSLFGGANTLAELYGIMLKIPELKDLESIKGSGTKHQQIASITMDWVAGESIKTIAQKYFSDEKDEVSMLMEACRAINRDIANLGTWGLSALTKMSAIDFENLPEEQRRELDMSPAMIYHGVHTPEAVLMRMNHVPRSIAEELGSTYRHRAQKYTVSEAKEYLRSLTPDDWERSRRPGASMSGADYQRIWKLFAGE